MRKKLQDKMFETSYLFELFISVIVGIAILVLGIRLAVDTVSTSIYTKGVGAMVEILDDAIILAIGVIVFAPFLQSFIEVLAFALARQLIVGHTAPWENLITVVAIAVLFAIRRFLLKSQDMVETPDGLVEIDAKEENKD